MYQGQSKFSGNLHALRGLAAVSVIFFHAWGMNAANIPSLGWMNFGYPVLFHSAGPRSGDGLGWLDNRC